MKKLIDLYRFEFDKSRREPLEWVNFWYDKEKGVNTKRYCFVGGSCLRLIRSTFARITQSPVDYIGTSAHHCDMMFSQQIDAFFSPVTYKYSTIFVNIGAHGIRGKLDGESCYFNNDGESFFWNNQDNVDYRLAISNLIEFLMQYSNRIVLLSSFDSVVPKSTNRYILKIHRLLKTTENYDCDENVIKAQKNEVLKNLAEEKQIQYLDINKYMRDFGRHYQHVDAIHYTRYSFNDMCLFMLNNL